MMTNGMNDDSLPERPRLRRGCRIFEDETGLIVRASRGAHRIASAHREAMLRVLAKLDGMHDFTALLGGERTEDAFYALRMVALLAHGGLIAEGPFDDRAQPPVPDAPVMSLDGITLILPAQGRISSALGRRLEALGASVLWGSVHPRKAQNAILIVCPDGPDLNLLEDTNRLAQKTRVAWLPVFPFGDAIVTGPLIRPGVSPCFRCFELRWLGISPSIALERAYFEHLRQAWKDEALDSRNEAARFAERIAPIVATYLAGPEADAQVTLIRPELGSISAAQLEGHPCCEVCADRTVAGWESGPAPEHASWFEPPVALAELRQRVELMDSICGLASIIPPPKSYAKARSTDLPEVAVARFAIPEPDQVDGEQDNWSHGSAASIEDARTLAIIEALERYNGLSQPATGVWASYTSVADQAMIPTELPLFSREQYARPGFPFQPFDPNRKTRWSRGYNLTRKKPVLVPATAAWYGRDDELLGETSSGVAAHSSRGHALLNGALEIVERDAFMIHWLHRISPPLVDLDQLHGTPCRTLIRHVEQSGYTVRLADLTTDLEIPACLAIGFHNDRQRPALLVGAGASLDPVVAATRALNELCDAALHETDLWILKPPVAPEDVLRLEDHGRAYEHPEWLPHASFLWASSRRSPLRQPDLPRDPLDQLLTLIALLEKHGHDLIGVDITATDVARHGLRVVRAIIPGLQPLGFGRQVRLGGRRLYEAPVRMGCRKAPVREEDLNKVPHCFP